MRSYACWMVFFVLVVLIVYDVKYSTHSSQGETRRLEAELVRERERLHMVELEWTRLSRPERIAALAQRHLELVPASPAAIQTSADIVLWPPREPPVQLVGVQESVR